MTAEDVIYSQISRKKHRIIPQQLAHEDKEATHPSHLTIVDNPDTLANRPCISHRVVWRLARLARQIETYYGMPMDIEFVYEPSRDAIFCVQARPIPESKDLETYSSVTPNKIQYVREKTPILTGTVITSDDAAKIITHPGELIIENTIETALNRYLNHPGKVKAVIVQHNAPPTSHAAAQFHANKIPVLQITDINKVRSWLTKRSLAVIVDPQRNQVFDWGNQVKNKKNIEQALYDKHEGILGNGLYKSTIGSHTTPIPFSTQIQYQNKNHLCDVKLESKKPSQSSIKVPNHLDTKLRALYALLPNKKTWLAQLTTPYSHLLYWIECIEAAIPGKQNSKAMAALENILGVMKNFALQKFRTQKQKITEETLLFQQAMIIGDVIHQQSPA